ncbi:HAMP domain-containing protein [Duganella sp. BJB488]|uniref:methyl-accepting chemotaxis protein n=1 Tax=unclassified Duganella TaxID=2636909 RepID=UPI000E34C986|nr:MULTISPECIES: methyl-accepting chemotaxis protein [unclassified Duganella]RFP09081.1 HAMP domain-containing protein [Duganella sp. BJB489]RFP12512.1 HAMP domain-containing protein [Duganella sp. BJB488]RFP29081.1 HAMP domain-containing protein [Duganella sp. BJB480]
MSFDHFKIGTRLSLGFGIVLALLVAIVVLGLSSMTGIGNRTQDIIGDKNVKVDAANRMLDNVRGITLSLTTTLVVASMEEVSAELDKIAASRKRYGEAKKILIDHVRDDQEKSMLARLDELLKTGAAKNNKVIELRKNGELQEAMTYLTQVAGPTLKDVQKVLDDIVAYETAQTRQAGDEVEAALGTAQKVLVGLGALAMTIGCAVGWFISRSITVPLTAAVGVAETVASGDLSSHIEVRTSDETGHLLGALRTMNDTLLNVVNQVRQGTDTIATASNEIAAGNLHLSTRTEEQASSLEQTASSMEQLTSTVKQNADNARQANTLACTASEVATKGGAIVSRVVSTMGNINSSSRKIVDIIGVIDGIAFQTNILALNAAVEAARAGEQGRGFAVVASEVRNLAQRSAAAAKEIKELISASVANVDDGSRLVGEAGQTMGDIVASIQRVTDIMGEITSASQEQTMGIEQINMAIAQMDEVTQQNAALVEQAAAASQSMQEQAAALAAVVGFFKTEADGGGRYNDRQSLALTPNGTTAHAQDPDRTDLPAADGLRRRLGLVLRGR